VIKVERISVGLELKWHITQPVDLLCVIERQQKLIVIHINFYSSNMIFSVLVLCTQVNMMFVMLL
jgi:hypothetical protein